MQESPSLPLQAHHLPVGCSCAGLQPVSWLRRLASQDREGAPGRHLGHIQILCHRLKCSVQSKWVQSAVFSTFAVHSDACYTVGARACEAPHHAACLSSRDKLKAMCLFDAWYHVSSQNRRSGKTACHNAHRTAMATTAYMLKLLHRPAAGTTKELVQHRHQ